MGAAYMFLRIQILILASVVSAVAWANPCEVFLMKVNPTQEHVAINVERFFGQDRSFSKTLRAILATNQADLGGRYILDQKITIPAAQSRLRSNDKFALKIMGHRKVLTQDDVAFYSSVSSNLEPDQITNVEVVRYLPDVEASLAAHKS